MKSVFSTYAIRSTFDQKNKPVRDSPLKNVYILLNNPE